MSQSTCVFCCCCYCCCFMRLPCKPFIFFYIGIQIILTKNWKLEIRRHQPFKIVKLLAKCLETKTFKLSLITISHYLLLSFIVTKRNWKEQKNQCCFWIHSSYISTYSAKPSSRPTTSPSSIQSNCNVYHRRLTENFQVYSPQQR